MNIEILGYLGSGCFTISLVPQIIKSYRTKSVKDISVFFTFILTSGLVFYLVYALFKHLTPLIISASVELLCIAYLLFLKYKYK